MGVSCEHTDPWKQTAHKLLPPGLPRPGGRGKQAQVAGANREIRSLLTTPLHQEFLQGGAYFPFPGAWPT